MLLLNRLKYSVKVDTVRFAVEVDIKMELDFREICKLFAEKKGIRTIGQTIFVILEVIDSLMIDCDGLVNGFTNQKVADEKKISKTQVHQGLKTLQQFDIIYKLNNRHYINKKYLK